MITEPHVVRGLLKRQCMHGSPRLSPARPLEVCDGGGFISRSAQSVPTLGAHCAWEAVCLSNCTHSLDSANLYSISSDLPHRISSVCGLSAIPQTTGLSDTSAWEPDDIQEVKEVTLRGEQALTSVFESQSKTLPRRSILRDLLQK